MNWNNTDTKWEAKLLQSSDIPNLAESQITNLTTDLGNKVSSINSLTPTSGAITLNLSNLNDATITTPTNNQVLQYITADSKWENKTLSLTTALNGLTDVSVTEGSGINNNFLYWNNTDTKWEAKLLQSSDIPNLAESQITNLTTDLGNKVSSINSITPTSGAVTLNLTNLNDVSISTPTSGQVVSWNATTSKWNATTPSSGGATALTGLTDVSVTYPTNYLVVATNNGIQKTSSIASPSYSTVCTTSNYSTNPIVAFGYGNGIYMMIDQNASTYASQVFTSTDLVTWTNQATLVYSTGVYVTDVWFDGVNFIAWGIQNSGNTHNYAYSTYGNLSSWSYGAVNSGSSNLCAFVSNGTSMYLACISGGGSNQWFKSTSISGSWTSLGISSSYGEPV